MNTSLKCEEKNIYKRTHATNDKRQKNNNMIIMILTTNIYNTS